MRKLLQSKAVVAGLVVVAVVAVAANFVKLPKPGSRALNVSARSSNPVEENTPAITFDVPPRPRFGAELILWRELFPVGRLRDPFALATARNGSPQTNTVQKLPSFSLQAISIEPGRSLAIIDHRVVAAGERLGDYEVERIDANKVFLTGPAGRWVLTLHSAPSPAHKSP